MNVSSFISSADKGRSSKKKIIIKGVLFYLKFLFILTIIILSLMVILNLFGVNTESLKYPLESEMNEMKNKGILYALFLVVFFGPFIEELSFRLGLSFKRAHIAISVGTFAYILISLLSGNGYFEDVYYKLPVSILVATLLYCRSQVTFDNIQQKYGRLIIWIMVLLFGFVHVLNYNIETTVLLPMYFVMCLPQVLMGIVFVYFRLNLGFLYALGFHCLLNGISFSLSLCTM